ncbi:uncharacterized protein METZ01_LOCUS271856, partial [marine metagenome]
EAGDLQIDGDLTVTGNDIKSSTAATAITLTGADVAVAGDLTVTGGNIKNAVTLDAGVTVVGNIVIGSADINEAELEILDGATASTDELNIMDGSATTQATVTLDATDGVVISDGDVMKQALVSDFATYISTNITNGTVVEDDLADDAVTLAKMAAITQGSFIVGGAGNAPTALDAKTSGQILVGNNTDLVSVAVSGDATLAANGALTIAGDAVTSAKIDDATIVEGDLADDAVTLA